MMYLLMIGPKNRLKKTFTLINLYPKSSPKYSTMNNIIIKNNALVILITLIKFLTLTSCSKELSSSQLGAEDKLIFTVGGINENLNNATVNHTYNQEEDFTANTTLKKVEMQSSSTTASELDYSSINNTKLKNDTKSKTAATIAMKNGRKYRILIYRADNNALVTSVQGVVGTSVEIPAFKNVSYKYYAYSYNSTDDIDEPEDLVNPEVETPTDSEFLYDSGTCSTNSFNTSIPITFRYKTAQILLELDTDRLFADITSMDVQFVESYLNKGTFSIKNGTISAIETYTKTISFDEIDTTRNNVKLARFYVADPSALANYKIKINTLEVKYPNQDEDELITIAAPQEITFGPFTPAAGKKLIGNLKLWYNFSAKTILHVTRIVGEDYSYAAQPYINYPQFSGAAFNMINEKRNYGTLSNSIVRVGAFTHIRCSTDGAMSTFLTSKPDIVIISVYYLMDDDDRTTLKKYIDDGGVVLLMTDGSVPADRNAQIPFFQSLFGNNTNINIANNSYLGGALYKLKNIDDEILNGPFGDVRGEHWGEDASATQAASNIDSVDITFYSEAKAANGTAAATGVTMFKHKRKHFFWIGDGGFLSNAADNGINAAYTSEPFATVRTTVQASTHEDPLLNYNNYPIPKPYGYSGNGIAVNATKVYNSVIFANIMSWAIANSEFFGINTGGLPENYINL